MLLLITALVIVTFVSVELVIVELAPERFTFVNVELVIRALVVVLFVIVELVVVPPVTDEFVDVELFIVASIIPPPDTKELLVIVELVANVFKRILCSQILMYLLM